MKIEFSEAHKYAFNANYRYSQLILCFTGNHDYILGKLKKIVKEMEENGKPFQTTSSSHDGKTCEVITTVWNGKVIENVEVN